MGDFQVGHSGRLHESAMYVRRGFLRGGDQW
jgi:hypothetical protein